MEKKSNKVFIISLIIFFVILIAASAVIVVYTLNSTKEKEQIEKKQEELKKEEGKVEKETKKVLTSIHKSSYYSPDTNKYTQYVIRNDEDLNIFRAIHPLSPEIKADFLKNRTVFVLIKEEGSGSTTHELLNVVVKNNKIHFNINTKTAEAGTMDMSTWYFVASFPNEDLEGIDIKEWKEPKVVKKEFNLTINKMV